jgi:arylsulfatase A-like enzyme
VRLRVLRYARLATLLLGLAACAPQGSGSPDVLLVVMDTVRADRLSLYGHDRPTSPYLERLAASGVVFDDCTTAGVWTWPSHASLFTGEPPTVHGAHFAVGEPQEGAWPLDEAVATRMRESLPTLAEHFAAAGYETVSVAANELLTPELGLVRGFHEAYQIPGDRDVVERAWEVLARPRERPLFLFINLMTAHAPYKETGSPWVRARQSELDPESAPEWVRPYLVEDELRGVDLRKNEQVEVSGLERYLTGSLEIPPEGMALLLDLYDGELALVDELMAAVLARWYEGKGREESIVAVASDHGELFGEHGLLEHRGHVYPELVHVPLVIAAPGRLPAGVRVSTPMQLHELQPMLRELAGLDAPAGSLDPLMAKGTRIDPILAVAWPSPALARVVGGRLSRKWVLYRTGEEAVVSSDGGDVEFYDLATDPSMMNDRSEEHPQRVRALLGPTRSLLVHAGPLPTKDLVFSKALRDRMRALGYARE